MQIVPGVHQLKIPIPDNPLGYLNAYLVQSDEGCLLIDTGWGSAEAFDCLKEQLRDAGVSLNDISLVVVTHVHPDHYGLAGRVREACTARFAFHLWEKAFLESFQVARPAPGGDQHPMFQFLRQHGIPEHDRRPHPGQGMHYGPHHSAPVNPDQTLFGGEIFRVGEFELEAIWTPGHSPGHVCLYESSKKLLFAGDQILAKTTPNVSYSAVSGSNPLGSFIHSLRQLKQLPIEVALPAHEDIIYDVKGRIDEIEVHHDERKSQMLAVIQEGPVNAFAVAGHVPWNVPDTDWEHMSFFIQRAAVAETVAHLEMLRMEGEIERSSRDGVFFYGCAASKASSL